MTCLYHMVKGQVSGVVYLLFDSRLSTLHYLLVHHDLKPHF